MNSGGDHMRHGKKHGKRFALESGAGTVLPIPVGAPNGQDREKSRHAPFSGDWKEQNLERPY